MSVTIDPAIRVKPSKKLLNFIETIDNVPKSLQDVNTDSKIELSDLKWIFENRSSHPECSFTFHELLNGSEVLLPEPTFPPRNPELDARVQKLRMQQEHREYNQMVSNVDGSSLKAKRDIDDVSISQQSKQATHFFFQHSTS